MAKKFLTPIDLTKNEIQNAVIQNLGSAPSSPVAGQFYYDTSTGKFNYRNASAWVDPTARANHSGTQLAATISDFDTQVRTSTINQMTAPTADFSMNTHKITNVTDGTGAQDAATYGQLQAIANGRDFKDAVRVASTANVATLSGLLTIDGVTVVAGDRVLLKNQTTGSQNGIYSAASGTWTRATDADSSAKVTSGMSVMVEEGTANGDTQWTLTTNNPITLATTALVFAQTGAGTTYTQGTGIAISGGSIAIDPAVVSRKYASNIGDNSATSIAVTHSLGTLDVIVQVVEISTGATVECDVVRNSTSQVTLGFAVAPTTAQFRVLVQG